MPAIRHGIGATPASAIRVSPPTTRRGDADLRERPALAVHRLEVGARLDLRQLDLEQQLAVLERRRAPVRLVREPVELLDRELAPVRPQPRSERDERRRHVGRMRRGAEPVREDRVLAVLAVARVAAVAAVEAAAVAEAPVPAPRRLQEVPAEGAHVAELRRRREPARLAQRRGDRRLDLELSERRPGSDRAAVARRAARRRARRRGVSAWSRPSCSIGTTSVPP